MIQTLINKMCNNEEVTLEEKNTVFHYFRHIPNARKTDEEFELYCRMAKEKGIPKPDRNSYIRPLHEKNKKSIL